MLTRLTCYILNQKSIKQKLKQSLKELGVSVALTLYIVLSVPEDRGSQLDV